ncbi:MAG: hypothetical protein AAB766_03000 [Patescibacteria group bacterium]
MTPYYLKSGPKAGQAMEAVMFELDGYYRLEAVLRKNDGSKDWLRRVKDLMRRADSPVIVAKCECGSIATHVGVAIRDCGVTILNTSCVQCHDQFEGFATAVPLKFSSIREYFRHEIDRKQFLRALRSACGLIESGQIPPQTACDVFYSSTPPSPAPAQKKITPPPIIQQPEQLPLF